MSGVKFSFFNLKFHAPFETQMAFDGPFSDTDYLKKNLSTILDSFDEERVAEELVRIVSDEDNFLQNYEIAPHLEIEILQSKCFDDLISANNLLFLQQKDFLDRCPLKLENGQQVFDVTTLTEKMGYGLPIAYVDEDEAEFESRIGDAFDAEINRWEEYANLYQTGYAAATVMIHIEKILIDVFNLLEKIDPEKVPQRRKTNLSVIDGKIQVLRDTYNLDFNLPPKLAETIMAARVARNNFAHGDWKKISMPFESLTARDLLIGANEFCNLLFEALGKKYND